MEWVDVALGGALGAIGRYTISLIPTKTEFPILTLLTNLIGAVLIGFIVGFIGDRDVTSKNKLLFWKTGVCGGFTTFSTFALESSNLLKNGHPGIAALYMFLSIAIGIAFVLISKLFIKK